MKKTNLILILLILMAGISACTPAKNIEKELISDKPVTTPQENPATQPADEPKKVTPSDDPSAVCVKQNGTWITEYAECEGIGKEACESNGGTFNECASACRHQPGATMCTMQCVLVCRFGNQTSDENQIVGGDKDEHGCIGSAGYLWCAEKNKCLRSWEESCDEKTEESIKQLFSDKYNKNLSEIKVVVQVSDNNHAKGTVRLQSSDGTGEGGLFWAAKKNDKWTLVYDGNGMADCKVFEPYKFPEEMILGACIK